MKILPLLLPLLVVSAILAAELIYKADFEDGFVSQGLKIKKELQYGGAIDVVNNPARAGQNTSAKVARCTAPTKMPDQNKSRAEISSARVVTDKQTYTYKMSYYIPSDFYTGSDFKWLILSQWKTWPCGYHDGHSATICDACGIFNDIHLTQAQGFGFRYRAKPDCKHFDTKLLQDEWVDFTVQVYWTQASDGWAKIFQNGKLVYSAENFRTLFTSFDSTQCNMYWAVGVYCRNEGVATEVFVDNLEIYDGIVSPEVTKTANESPPNNADKNQPIDLYLTANSLRINVKESQVLSIAISDALGKQVYNSTTVFTGSHEYSFRHKLKSGVYTIHIKTPQELILLTEYVVAQ